MASEQNTVKGDGGAARVAANDGARRAPERPEPNQRPADRWRADDVSPLPRPPLCSLPPASPLPEPMKSPPPPRQHA